MYNIFQFRSKRHENKEKYKAFEECIRFTKKKSTYISLVFSLNITISKVKTKSLAMNKMEPLVETNALHAFLRAQGVPENKLPRLITIYKEDLTPLKGGHKKEAKNKKFYLCVCCSGHSINCGDLEWQHSMWTMRVKGDAVIFRKNHWEFNITEIPVSSSIFFVVSTRTISSPSALDRSDIIYVNNCRDKLLNKPKKPETNRHRKY